MKSMIHKNTIFIGAVSGLAVSVICLLMAFPRGMTVWYQLLAVLAAGITLGYICRNKVRNSIAISGFGAVLTLSATRMVPWINEASPVLFSLFFTVVSIGIFFLLGKFFELKMNNILRYGILTILFMTCFFVIPLINLYAARQDAFKQQAL